MNLILDNIDDADGAALTSRPSATGGQPAEHDDFTAGGASVVSGAAYPTGSGATIISWPNSYTDGIAEAVFDVKSSILDQLFGLLLRSSSADPLWYFGGTGNSAGVNYESFVYDAGTASYLLGASGTGYASGEHRVKLSAVGNLIRFHADRREVLRIRNTSYASGKFGLYWGTPGTTTTGIHCKSVRVVDDDTRSQVQFVGDSMFFVPSLTHTNRVPYQTMAPLIAEGLDVDWSNLGQSGRRLTLMLTSSQTTTTTNAFDQNNSAGHGAFACRRPNAAADVIALWGGINDLSTLPISGENVSAATCISRLIAYRDAAKALGFRVVVFTIPLCGGNAGAGFNAKALEVNSWIREHATSFAGVVDLFKDPRVSEQYTNLTYRSVDQVHMTDAANALIAEIARPVIRRALIFRSVPTMTEHHVVSSLTHDFSTLYAGGDVDYGNPEKFDAEADDLESWVCVTVPTINFNRRRTTSPREGTFRMQVICEARVQDDLYACEKLVAIVSNILEHWNPTIRDYTDPDEPVVGRAMLNDAQVMGDESPKDHWQRRRIEITGRVQEGTVI